jgi:hypothetical protein
MYYWDHQRLSLHAISRRLDSDGSKDPQQARRRMMMQRDQARQRDFLARRQKAGIVSGAYRFARTSKIPSVLPVASVEPPQKGVEDLRQMLTKSTQSSLADGAVHRHPRTAFGTSTSRFVTNAEQIFPAGLKPSPPICGTIVHTTMSAYGIYGTGSRHQPHDWVSLNSPCSSNNTPRSSRNTTPRSSSNTTPRTSVNTTPRSIGNTRPRRTRCHSEGSPGESAKLEEEQHQLQHQLQHQPELQYHGHYQHEDRAKIPKRKGETTKWRNELQVRALPDISVHERTAAGQDISAVPGAAWSAHAHSKVRTGWAVAASPVLTPMHTPGRSPSPTPWSRVSNHG